MLREFRVKNFLSFKDSVTFSMVAAPISGLGDRNIAVIDAMNLKLLKSSVVYGANASGKSNLLKAMGFMRRFVLDSSKEMQAAEAINVENFRLSSETEGKPSFFEISFICDSKKFRYGFEIDQNGVHAEWLFFVPSRTEATLFTRKNDDIKISTKYFSEGKGLQNKTRPNALFLSVVAQFNGELSTKILKWFMVFNLISGINDRHYMGYTLAQLENDQFKKKFLKYLRVADFGIHGIQLKKMMVKFSELPESMKILFPGKTSDVEEIEGTSTEVMHLKYDKDNNPISTEAFDFDALESEGTKKFWGLFGPLIHTLENGSILVVDELDARLHPKITQFIIELFHSKQTNPKNAQFIFATHDTNFLTNRLFRRDQIWFTEKDEYGATDLYSLVEFKIRKDASFEKDYIQGKYGAIPFIGDVEALLGELHE